MAEFVMRIAGVHPTLDGDYPIDLSALTNRDLHDIKRISGVRSQELTEAFGKGDTDLFVALAVIALRYAGKPLEEDVLWDAPVASLSLIDGDAQEEDELPPASAPPSVTPSVLGGGGGQSEESTTSGSPSRSDAATAETGQNGTGTPHSDTGVTYPFPMSAT